MCVPRDARRGQLHGARRGDIVYLAREMTWPQVLAATITRWASATVALPCTPLPRRLSASLLVPLSVATVI